MRKVLIILLLSLLWGSCGLYYRLSTYALTEWEIHCWQKPDLVIDKECLSNGLLFFNQDGIYFIPEDSCCFITDIYKDVDGLIIRDMVSSDRLGNAFYRQYGQNDLENIKAVKYNARYYEVRSKTGVNDATYFIKFNESYVVNAQIRLYEYNHGSDSAFFKSKWANPIYPLYGTIVGQEIRFDFLSGIERGICFDIVHTESIDSIQLAEFLERKKTRKEVGIQP